MTDLATLTVLRDAMRTAQAAADEACRAYDAAISAALWADFPRHRAKCNPWVRWEAAGWRSVSVALGHDRDDVFTWLGQVSIDGLTRSHATGPTPYAAVCAALDALNDTKARDALRAAVEATR